MLPYKNLIIIKDETQIPVYRQIAVQFIGLIQEGKLLPGTLLPSTRSLAFDLQLHRKTIIAAYEVLVSEDWIDNLPRKGYIVSTDLPLVRPRTFKQNRSNSFSGKGVLNFQKLNPVLPHHFKENNGQIIIDDGFPDISLLPAGVISKQFQKSLDYFTYRVSLRKPVTEHYNLQVSLCTYLKQTRGFDIETENIFVTRGAQMAIYIAASLIIKPGDKVIVSDPSYFIANAVFEKLGAQLIPVPVDQDGMCTDTIEEILKKNDIRMMYVIPHHHHPTTVTMSVERRKHLLHLINQYDIAVIEDDYDYDFQFKYDPYLPLASDDHGGKIIYIGSLTKVLGTPFRLGYMISTTDFLEEANKMRRMIDIRGDVIIEEAAANLINNGDLTRHIQHSNKIYAQRCNFLSELLHQELNDSITFTKPSGGMAIWVKLNPEYRLEKVVNKAEKSGLLFYGSVYAKGEKPLNAFRFGFASLPEDELLKAVEILKNSIN